MKGCGLIFRQMLQPFTSNSQYNTSTLVSVCYSVCKCVHMLFLVSFMAVYLAISVEPLAQINALTAINAFPLPMTAKSQISNLISKTRPFSISSGYGLFRMMTGVGENPTKKVGIGGLEVPVVARPEIILEGSSSMKCFSSLMTKHLILLGFSEADNAWRTIEFLYKPSDLFTRPPLAAPHQPRLDWQM